MPMPGAIEAQWVQPGVFVILPFGAQGRLLIPLAAW